MLGAHSELLKFGATKGVIGQAATIRNGAQKSHHKYSFFLGGSQTSRPGETTGQDTSLEPRIGVRDHAGALREESVRTHKIEPWFPTASGVYLFQNYLLAPSLWL